jgi:hypothetical protein
MENDVRDPRKLFDTKAALALMIYAGLRMIKNAAPSISQMTSIVVAIDCYERLKIHNA